MKCNSIKSSILWMQIKMKDAESSRWIIITDCEMYKIGYPVLLIFSELIFASISLIQCTVFPTIKRWIMSHSCSKNKHYVQLYKAINRIIYTLLLYLYHFRIMSRPYSQNKSLCSVTVYKAINRIISLLAYWYHYRIIS